MQDKLLIVKGSNMLNRLTAINGNVDIDKLTPSIWCAQITDIKRVLTNDLYERILSDFDSNPSLNNLTGIYLEIFNEFVTPLLVFYTTADFIMKNSIMISNGGNFKHNPENSQVPDYKEVDRLSKYYREMGATFELSFYEFMKDKNIPEYKRNTVDTNTFKFNWYMN